MCLRWSRISCAPGLQAGWVHCNGVDWRHEDVVWRWIERMRGEVANRGSEKVEDL